MDTLKELVAQTLFIVSILLPVLMFIVTVMYFKDMFEENTGDMNHDNELTIKDLSILAAQINNK